MTRNFRYLKALKSRAREMLVGKPVLAKAFSRRSRSPDTGAGPDTAITELGKKLWSGFSRHARSDLDQLIRATPAAKEKALAAWELAKFLAAQGQWDESLHYLESVREADAEFLHSSEAGLLYIEAMTACGRTQEAERHAQQNIDRGKPDAEYLCALSNVIAVKAAHEQNSDAHLQRLALLNEIYRDSQLAELELIDPARGFIYGNLTVAGNRLLEARSPGTVSVILTVFNEEQHVSASVAGILNQTWRAIELVIVDDASTDASWELIESLAAEDARIVCARNATRMGRYGARNRALSLASGDYVTVHDGDRWSHPQMLQTKVEAMLADADVKLVFSGTATVTADMRYVLEPGQGNNRYVRRQNRSCVIRKADLQHLDKWDVVGADADEEFVRRAGAIWGSRSLRDVLPQVPMSLGLNRPSAAGEEIDVSSPASETLCEYAKQAEFWRRTVLLPAMAAGQRVTMDRTGTKQPFPVPRTLAPGARQERRHYDVVLISDLTLLGGTRRCNEGYIAAATALGMRVGLLHWPRYDLRLSDDIASEYRRLSYGENVDILTLDDCVSADFVLIHHPPVMKYVPDAVPDIDTRRLAILVNQLPERIGEPGCPYYDRAEVEAVCLRLFGMRPVWIPISPLVRRVLSESGFAQLAKEDWIPPLGGIVAPPSHSPAAGHRPGRLPVIGRHSRDHWTKWPELERDLQLAYCANSHLRVRFMGGATHAKQVVRRWPQNWEDLPFDSLPVGDFLDDLDFFLHFTHSGYIEEFGRNIMEAMAAGVPAIVPPRFREVFGDAACYAEPQRVEALIYRLWDNGSAYAAQVEKGIHFVRETASNERVERRLAMAVDGSL